MQPWQPNPVFRYSYQQKHSEDYDLWLQVLSDKHTIEKIPEQLLQYRVHAASVTGSFHRKKNPFFTNATTKYKFLNGRIKQSKFGLFECSLVIATIQDVFMGIGKTIKKWLKK